MTIFLLVCAYTSASAQLKMDVTIEKEIVNNDVFVKVSLKNTCDYHFSLWTNAQWLNEGCGFNVYPESYFVFIGNPSSNNKIVANNIVFSGTLDDFGMNIKRRVRIMKGETYTDILPVFAGGYCTPQATLPFYKKNEIKELQVKVVATDYDPVNMKVVVLEFLSNVIKL